MYLCLLPVMQPVLLFGSWYRGSRLSSSRSVSHFHYTASFRDLHPKKLSTRNALHIDVHADVRLNRSNMPELLLSHDCLLSFCFTRKILTNLSAFDKVPALKILVYIPLEKMRNFCICAKIWNLVGGHLQGSFPGYLGVSRHCTAWISNLFMAKGRTGYCGLVRGPHVEK